MRENTAVMSRNGTRITIRFMKAVILMSSGSCRPARRSSRRFMIYWLPAIGFSVRMLRNFTDAISRLSTSWVVLVCSTV